MECVSGVFPGEAPRDCCVAAIRAARSGVYFRAQVVERLEAPSAEALARDETEFDLGLIEPAAVSRGVVHGEAAPQPSPFGQADVDRKSVV